MNPAPHPLSSFPVWLCRAALAMLLFWPGVAAAVTFTVTNLNDAGPGSLRGMISQAKLLPGTHTINFSVTGTVTLTSGELLIEQNLTIQGPGAHLLTVRRSGVEGTPAFRIIRILAGSQQITVNISGLKLQNGAVNLGGGGGGGIFFQGHTTGALPRSALILRDCNVDNNDSAEEGGGLRVRDADLTVQNSTFFRNLSIERSGGGLSMLRCTARIENCTVMENQAEDGGGMDVSSSEALVTNCTIANNILGHVDTPGGASGIKCSVETTLTLRSSIVEASENPFDQMYWRTLTERTGAQVISGGYNVCSDAGVNLNNAGDQLNTDPQIRGMEDNGGPVPTARLEPDSPAVDRGNSFGLTTDQRGMPRTRNSVYIPNAPLGDGTDAGAFEITDFFQQGANVVVTTTDDRDDRIAGQYDCTLREALNYANYFEGPEPAVVTFAPGISGVIKLDPALGPLPVFYAGITLAGPGARRLAVSGERGVRPLLICETFYKSGSTISGLTFRNGQVPGTAVDGAALVNRVFPNQQPRPLVIRACAFTDNSALGITGSQPGQAGGTARGGAIFNTGVMTVQRSTFKGNTARGGGGANAAAQFGTGGAGGDGVGAAIYNGTGGVLTADSCSFFANTAAGGNGGSNTQFGGGNGGHGCAGIYNLGTVTLTSCTFTLNVASRGAGGTGNTMINNGASGTAGGALFNSGVSFTVGNTVLAGNTGTNGPDAVGTFTSGGFNLVGRNNGTAGFTATGDQSGTTPAPLDARLGTPGNNGGPTDTVLLLAGSPAIDKGRRFGLDTDQRNLPRSHDDAGVSQAAGGDGTDIGAVEMRPVYSGPPELISIVRTGTQMRMVLQGAAGTSYQLKTAPRLSTNIVGPLFQDLGTPQTTDSIGQTEFIDYGPLVERRFYRAFQEP
jgi:CSLREA domain-containing protein